MTRIRWPFWLILGLLVLIAAVTLWDYIEVFRLDREFARIESLGEPTTTKGLDSTTTTQEETAASRYYRAAVALVNHENRPGETLFHFRIGQARRSNEWPDELLFQMRERVSANEEALSYLDKAAALEFEGFREYPPITTYHLDTLLPIAELRTTILAADGRGDEAARSLYSALRLQRTGFWSFDDAARPHRSTARRSDPISLEYLTRQLRVVVTRTRPSADNLALLAEGFAALDNDDLVLHDLLWLRAASRLNVGDPYWWLRRGGAGASSFKLGEALATSIQAPLYRPLLLHYSNRRLRDYGEAIAAQEGKRWPDKLDVLAEVERRPGLWEVGTRVARELTLIRCARTIIAIEQYRRLHAERTPDNWSALSTFDAPLIDPFSGQPLRILVSDDRYLVYSVGENRRDDAGRVDAEGSQVGQRSAVPPDTGIAVTLNKSSISNP